MLISDFPFVRTRHCQLSNGDARIFVFSRNTRPRLFPFCVVKIILAPPAKPLWALILAVPTQPSPEAVTSSPPPAVGSLRRRPLQTAPSAPHSCTSSSSCSSYQPEDGLHHPGQLQHLQPLHLLRLLLQEGLDQDS